MEPGLEDQLVFEPLLDHDGLRVSRSPWGPGDEIGRLNWMSSASQAAILARVDGSQGYDLAVDLFPGMPAWTEAGDPEYEQWMTHTPQGSVTDGLTGAGAEAHRRYAYAGSALRMYSHTGTHLCGLNHIGHHGTFWDGLTEDRLGADGWESGGRFPPIVARGVLLDIAALREVDCLPDSYAITVEDVRRGYEQSAAEPRRGDVVVVRTGRMTRWPDPDGFLTTPPGLGMDAARFLCEWIGAMCVGLDCGGEVLPPEQPDTFLPVHAYLFATAGAPLFENLWLEDLARERVAEFVFVAAPLKLRGSTGMPVRPLAFALAAS